MTVLQEPLPTVERFLELFLECWNGEDYREQVLKLLSYTSLQPFEELSAHYLQPLQQLCAGKGLELMWRTVGCLTGLLRFWGAVEWPRSCRRREMSLEVDGEHLR